MQQISPLAADAGGARTGGRASRFTCFYSHCDNIVFPPATATLPGADNRHIAGVPHVHMADRPEPWAELQRWLAATPAR
jgi:triacylglycerol lipase